VTQPANREELNTHKNSHDNRENDFLLLFQIQFAHLQYIHVYNIAEAYKYSITKYNRIIMYEIVLIIVLDGKYITVQQVYVRGERRYHGYG